MHLLADLLDKEINTDVLWQCTKLQIYKQSLRQEIKYTKTAFL